MCHGRGIVDNRKCPAISRVHVSNPRGMRARGKPFLKVGVRALRVLGWPVMMTDPVQALVQQYAQLLSLASHEFRTPASVVGGYLRMLQRDTESPLSERQRKMVDEASRSCARLVELIAELSDVAKLDGGATPLRAEPVDLFALLGELAGNVHEGDDRELQLHLSGSDTGAFITGDRARLAAAFTTFIRTILREQPSAGTVVVDRRVVGDRGQTSAMLVVAAAADVQRAYDVTPSVLNEKRGGLGLSLAIARRVVERHGGRVWSPTPDGPDDRGLKSALVVSIPLVE